MSSRAQGLLPIQEAGAFQGVLYPHAFLEFSSGETVSVNVQVLLVFLSLSAHDIHVFRPAQYAVEVAHLGVAQVEVKSEVLPDKADGALERTGVIIGPQGFGVETLQQEVQGLRILLSQVFLDLFQQGIEALPVLVLVVRGKVGEA